ncbi:MAG TPA: hypothetical protein VHZ01_07855 [Casimicrobiaceae bacterium]|nr:hypothetical protein [Casimicrobiaceae bacterium]
MDRSQRAWSRRSWRAAHAFAAASLAIGATAASAATVGEAAADDLPSIWAQAATSLTQTADPAAPQLSPETMPRPAPQKNYVLPAVEIVGFSFLLNQYNRHFSGDDDYKSNISTIRHNLHSSWVVDSDPFRTNQLGHPYL